MSRYQSQQSRSCVSVGISCIPAFTASSTITSSCSPMHHYQHRSSVVDVRDGQQRPTFRRRPRHYDYIQNGQQQHRRRQTNELQQQQSRTTVHMMAAPPAEGAAAKSGGCFNNHRQQPDNGKESEMELESDWRTFRAHMISASRIQQPIQYHDSVSSLRPNNDNENEVTRTDTSAHAVDDSGENATSAVTTRSVNAGKGNNEDEVFWAHPIAHLEVGAVLVAKKGHQWPSAFSHLRKAVALITDIRPSGISALLLNRPTRYTVGTHRSVLARAGNAFANNRVFLGGDCSTGTLAVVHKHPPHKCPGASPIIPGVYKGGMHTARQILNEQKLKQDQMNDIEHDNNLLKADDFRFYVAYAKWTHQAFQAEFQRDAWHIAACSPHLILAQQSLKDDSYLWNTLQSFLA